MFFYKFYNTIFKSDLCLSSLGLQTINSNHYDVEIVLKNSLSNSFDLTPIFTIEKRQGYFFRKGIGLYKSINGSLIEVHPFQSTEKQLLKENLINFPLALCMSQRGYLAIHGSSVCIKDSIYIFSGPSHAGKSTLAAFFFSKKHDLFSEDISIVDTKDNMLFPSNRYIKLSPIVAEILNMPGKFEYQPKGRDRQGYLLPKEDFVPRKVKNIYFLKWSDNNEIKKMPNKEALKNLLKYSFISEDSEDSVKVLNILSKSNFYELFIKKDLKNLENIYKMLVC